jgi:hypothetical protein
MNFYNALSNYVDEVIKNWIYDNPMGNIKHDALTEGIHEVSHGELHGIFASMRTQFFRAEDSMNLEDTLFPLLRIKLE